MSSATFDWAIKLSYLCEETTLDFRVSKSQRVVAKVDGRTGDINTVIFHSSENLYENDPCVSGDYEVWRMYDGAGVNLYDNVNEDDVPTYPYTEYRSNDYLHFGSREQTNRVNIISNWVDHNYRWGIYSYAAGTLDVDWIFVRQFNVTEPSTSIGSEERKASTTPNPTNLLNTTGNFWVNYTWSAGSGNVTDSFNVSMNGTWTNDSALTYMNVSVGSGGWANITVWAWNASGTGTLSAGCVSDEVQAPEALLTCTCGDICVNGTGWWRNNGVFNASSTQIQAAVDNASSGETIYVYNGTYSENVDVAKQLTLTGEGADVVNVTNSTADSHVFNVSANYVNISGFNVTGATGNMKAGIYIGNGVDHCNISDNIGSNNYIGIYLNSSSSDNLFADNTISDNTWDLYIKSSASSFTNNTLNGTMVSFTYAGDVSLKSEGSPVSNPNGRYNISEFINATNHSAGAWLFLNFSYSDSDVSGLDESSLAVWKHNGTAWVEDGWNGSRYLDTANNVVGVNITTFSVFAPLANSSGRSCSIVNVTPDDLLANSTGTFTAIINCTDPDGINTSRFFMTRTVEGGMYLGGVPNRWSIRPPVNDIAQSHGSFPQILRAYNRGKGDWYDFAGLFTDNYSYGVHDITSSYVNITNGTTWAELNYTWVVEPTVFRSSFFLDRKLLVNETKKEYNVYADHPLLVKFWDLEHMRGTANYTACVFRNIFYSGTPNADLKAYYCNDSYRTVSEALPNYGASDATANMTGNVLLMHMDETSGTIVDYSGEENNGTVHGGVTYGAEGKINTALSYDGNGNYVSVVNDPSLEITGPITLAAWVNFNSLGATRDFNGIVAKWDYYDTGGGYGLFKAWNTNRIAFITASQKQTGYADAYSNSIPSLHEWYHVVGTYDGSTMRLYINGELQTDTGYQPSGIYDNDEPVTIGTFETNHNFWFDGEIDEVAIWNRTLSAAEVLNLYKRGVRKPSRDTDNCVYFTTIDTTDLNDIYYTSRNSSYSKSCYGINNSQIGGIDATDTYYIAYESDTTAGNYKVRYVNGSSGTNVSFANSKVAWSSTDDADNWAQTEFTPDVWFAAINEDDQFQLGVYVEDNLGNSYTNFTLYTDDIGDVNHPITKPSIAYYENAGGTKDYYLNGSYAGNMTITVHMAKDPDAPGTVNHSLYLYNPDGTYNRTINSSFYSSDDSNVNVIFNTSTVQDAQYRMNVTAVADDNSSDVETYLTPDNFTVDNTAPNTTLESPAQSYFNNTPAPVNVTFVCNATDNFALDRISLYITNATNQSFGLNQTTFVSGTPASANWTLSLSNGDYTWNCVAYDDAGNSDWGDSNRTVKINATPGPALEFIDPTPSNNSNQTENYAPINISIATSTLDTFKFNWNGTNYTIYNSSLILAMNLNNNSAIGEDATHFVDISEFCNDGTCSGNNCPTFTSAGKFGGAYVFNGSSDYIDCGNAASLNITTAITIEAWAKISGGSSNYPRIVSKRSQGPYELVIKSNEGGVMQLALNDTGYTTHYCNGATNVSDGEWHHLAGTWNGSVMHVYVDGELDDTGAASFSGTLLTNNFNAWIGAQGNGPGDFLDGTVDEVRIYNRALSADELWMHYQSEIQKYNSTTWRFYDNVTNLATAQYLYYGWAEDTAGLNGQTETRTLNVANAPSITLNLPANGSRTSLNWVILNATVTDAEDDNMTVYFYANNDSNGLNASDGLVYIAENVANGSTVTYNLTALPVKPSEANLSLLMHFDNRSEYGEDDTHVYDFSGNGNNGTVNGNPVYDISGGKFAGAFEFDGTGDYVDCGNDPGLPENAPFTVSAWVKLNTLSQSWRIITDKYHSDAHVTLSLYKSNLATFSFTTGNGNWGDLHTGTIVAHQWYHVVAVWNGTTKFIYLDGSLADSINPDTTREPCSGAGDFTIGGRDGAGAECINGVIDEVVIYNRSLSADEILNQYRLGEGKYYWQVNATDGVLSNESDVWEFTIGADPTAPSIQLNYPDDKANLNSSTVNFNWTATDNIDDVLLCNLTIDGVVNQSNIASTSGQPTNRSVSGLSTGAHNWSVTCRNDTPNVNTSEMRTFGVNDSAPNVTMNRPPNGSTTPNNWVILNATVTDADDDPMTVYFYANNNSNGLNASEGLVYIGGNVANGTTLTYNLTALPIKPSEANLSLLMHFDNRSEFGERTQRNVANAVYDFSGNGNNGTLGNVNAGTAPTWNATGGKFAGAFEFDGTDDFINCGNDPLFDITNNLTLEAWVNFETISSYYTGIVAKWCWGCGGDSYGLFKETGASNIFSFHIWNGSNSWILSDSVFATDTWYHVVGTYNGTTMLMYVNGVQQTQTLNCGNNIITSTSPVTIGIFDNNNNFCLDGEIDEVAIYNRTLSAEEILDHYRLGGGKYYWKVNATDGVLSNESDVWDFSVFSETLEIRNQTASQSISSINFLGASGSTRDNPYNNVDSSGSPQNVTSKTPVVTIYNPSSSTDYKIWLKVEEVSGWSTIINDEKFNVTADDTSPGAVSSWASLHPGVTIKIQEKQYPQELTRICIWHTS